MKGKNGMIEENNMEGMYWHHGEEYYVGEKEKQIEEMANIVWRSPVCNHFVSYTDCSFMAEAIYNEGYRKQSEGEWIKKEKMYGKVSSEAVCSNCGRDVVYQVIDNKWAFENFCPHCGLKMKGVE